MNIVASIFSFALAGAVADEPSVAELLSQGNTVFEVYDLDNAYGSDHETLPSASTSMVKEPLSMTSSGTNS
jgi:hypothetical protein